MGSLYSNSVPRPPFPRLLPPVLGKAVKKAAGLVLYEWVGVVNREEKEREGSEFKGRRGKGKR